MQVLSLAAGEVPPVAREAIGLLCAFSLQMVILHVNGVLLIC